MENKKILYILTILLTLFSFNKTANAAQELTCVYYEDNNYSYAFVQQNDGTKKIYYNEFGNANTTDSGWTLDHYYILSLEDYPTENGNLTSCPPFAWIDSYEELSDWNIPFKFSTTENDLELDTNNSANIVKDLEIVTSGAPEQLNDEWLTNNTANVTPDNFETSTYAGSCKYARMYEDGSEHIIQIDFGKEKMFVTEYDPQKKHYSGRYDFQFNSSDGPIITQGNNRFYSVGFYFYLHPKFTLDYFLSNDGFCLDTIMVKRTVNKNGNELGIFSTIYTDDTTEEVVTYIKKEVRGYNPQNGQKLSAAPSDGINFDYAEITNCSQIFGDKNGTISKVLNFVWNIIKIGIPIILIAFGVIDMATAIFSGKEDGTKKNQEKFVKRIIIAIIIFIVPFLLELLLEIANNIWPSIGTDICGIIF